MSKTVDLAWKLGCVEVIPFGNNSRTSCQFSHLIVIDFETTCWKGDERNKGRNEIIEFPAVLMDMKDGRILDEFRQFVVPFENPKLSDFCKSFTAIPQIPKFYLLADLNHSLHWYKGITQDEVDRGLPLKACLHQFTQWLKLMQSQHGITCLALVTWSDWDLNVCLVGECKRKAISKPAVFSKWIDLRALYKEHTKKPPRGLRSAVEDMGLTFTGREHSGIIDARNTAKLAWKLYQDGLNLRITKDLTAS